MTVGVYVKVHKKVEPFKVVLIVQWGLALKTTLSVCVCVRACVPACVGGGGVCGGGGGGRVKANTVLKE